MLVALRREALTPETVTDPKRLLAAVGADRGKQTLWVGDCLWGQSLATHCHELRFQLGIAAPPEQDAADRRAEGRQPIADIDAAGEDPGRAGARNEHHNDADKHGERADLPGLDRNLIQYGLQYGDELVGAQI